MRATFHDHEIECSSGKGANDENFPVGSFLLAPPLRPHVAAFYAFARAADDIADNGDLSSEEKRRRLDAYEDVLCDRADGLTRPDALRRSLREAGVTTDHGVHLLDAFRQDADKQRYETMDDLLAYCELSANPVGRFLLDLHGEDRALWPASDGLCSALQILNHLQDCGEDRRDLDRVYIPIGMLRDQAEDITVVDRGCLSDGFRLVMNDMLDVCGELTTRAEELVSGLKSRRLAAESAVIIRLARRLEQKLRVGDPLASRVSLTKTDFAFAGVGGMWAGFVRSSAAQKRAA